MKTGIDPTPDDRPRRFNSDVIDAAIEALSAVAAVGVPVDGLTATTGRMGGIGPASGTPDPHFRTQIDRWREVAAGDGPATSDRAERRFLALCEIQSLTGRSDVALDAWTASSRSSRRLAKRFRGTWVYVASVWALGLGLWWMWNQTTGPMLADVFAQIQHRGVAGPNWVGSRSAPIVSRWAWPIAALVAATGLVWIGWRILCGRIGMGPTGSNVGETKRELVAAGVPSDRAAVLAGDLLGVAVTHPPAAGRDDAGRRGGLASWWRWGITAAATPRLAAVGLSMPIVVAMAVAVFAPLFRLYRLLVGQTP